MSTDGCGASALMVQGTSSDAGKTTFVAALCRLLSRRGIRVAPFKPQNMALNSAVTADGREIGRAQALQAEAAGLAPHSDMNPVLLKPSSDIRAQVVIHGQVHAEMSAGAYHEYKTVALHAVLESYERLRSRFELILVEGAGSPAEVNLRERDIANMGFAQAVDCPVVLIGDIDRGGVFAQFVGTLECLSPSDRERVIGFVVNRFRGDRGLLQPGIEWLEKRTGRPVFGVLAYLTGLHLEAEDAIERSQCAPAASTRRLRVAIIVYPRISNHTDFDVLRAHPRVDVMFVGPGMAFPHCDLAVLPGTKNTRTDLGWLVAQGFDTAIKRHLRYGGKLIGICGGMQMLGRTIRDPLGVEGATGSSAGLGLLDFETTMRPQKMLRQTQGRLRIGANPLVRGFEIHMGESLGRAMASPAIELDDRTDGVLSDDGQVLGTYLHGLFDHSEACAALLGWAGLPDAEGLDRALLRARSIDRLADAVERDIDVDRMLEAAGGQAPSRRLSEMEYRGVDDARERERPGPLR